MRVVMARVEGEESMGEESCGCDGGCDLDGLGGGGLEGTLVITGEAVWCDERI